MRTQVKEEKAAPQAAKQNGATETHDRILHHTDVSEKEALQLFPQKRREMPKMAPNRSERHGIWLQLEIRSTISGKKIWGYFPITAEVYSEKTDRFEPLSLDPEPSQVADVHFLSDVEEGDLEKLKGKEVIAGSS